MTLNQYLFAVEKNNRKVKTPKSVQLLCFREELCHTLNAGLLIIRFP